MLLTSPPARTITRRAAVAAALAAACLTLLFATQEVMRRGGGASWTAWRHALLTNILDWGSWLLLVPVIVAVGRRNRLDATGRTGRRALTWIALGVACCIAQGVLSGAAMHSLDLLRGYYPMKEIPPLPQFVAMWTVSSAGFNFIIFAMIAGVFHAALYYADLQARQVGESELRARLARAELGALRMQLQPHFLFNALHTISSLMTHDVPTARRVISALGDLLRSSIDHTALEEIPLADEVGFVRRYIEIQQARFRQRLSVQLDVPADTMAALVPSLVLQPLVENSIRHGIEPFASGGRVTVSARREGDRLVLVVHDDGGARDGSAASPVPAGAGTGLANLEARLTQLYGESHELTAARLPNGDFRVAIALPWHTSPRPAAAESAA